MWLRTVSFRKIDDVEVCHTLDSALKGDPEENHWNPGRLNEDGEAEGLSRCSFLECDKFRCNFHSEANGRLHVSQYHVCVSCNVLLPGRGSDKLTPR